MQPSTKVALVSGAGRGIGRAVALALAEAGADVALTSRTQDELDEVAAEVEARGRRALTVVCDISDPREVQALMDAIAAWQNRLDILVNNAGGAHVRRELHELSPEDFERGIALNLGAAHHCMHGAAPLLFRQPGSSVVNVVSIAATRGLEGMSYYSAAKAGVVGLTKAAAHEWGPRGVRVNCVAPGWIDTALSVGLKRQQDFYDRTLREIPLARWGKPHEIANVVAFLASDEASYVNGTTVYVDGGLLA
jgi:NAD(P)-dependent dehydrogenase (short-subunit alcohol dehydrogenase family)